MTDSWHVFKGTGEPHDGWDRVPEPMPARTFNGGPLQEPVPFDDSGWPRRVGRIDIGAHQLRPRDLDLVNAALFCRRPLLVTGRPGLGKSTLAYLIARELKLGPVLSWPVNSRTNVWDGLYQYDALRRFEEAQFPGRLRQRRRAAVPTSVTDYLALGPLGTAMLPYKRPRVLLIDEIDKADVDLPNDLLHVLEDGEYPIPELSRMRAYAPSVRVTTADGEKADIVGGTVRCNAFPVVVMTSNGERDFPPAFRRRCLQLQLDEPQRDQVESMVRSHLGDDLAEQYSEVITTFIERRSQYGAMPTDRLLIAIHLLSEAIKREPDLSDEKQRELAEQLMQPIEQAG